MKATPKTKKDLIKARKILREAILLLKEISPELDEIDLDFSYWKEKSSTYIDLNLTRIESFDKHLETIIKSLKAKGL